MKKIMNIEIILMNTRMSRALIGLDLKKFNSLLVSFEQILREQRKVKKYTRKIGGGRIGNWKYAKRKLFFILFYMKNYPTFDVAAFLFGSSKTSTCDWMHETLPVLEKALGRKLVLPKRQISTPEEFFALFPGVREVLLDGLERPTIRSKKDKVQRKHYSGKKARHTRKNDILATKDRRIILITPTKHGKVHDKKMNDKFIIETRVPKSVTIIADTGFMGIQHGHKNTLMPKKKTKGKILTPEDKEMNKLISRERIPVEHAIGGMKRYGASSKIFRNKNGIDDKFQLVCAGLWNFHLKEE